MAKRFTAAGSFTRKLAVLISAGFIAYGAGGCSSPSKTAAATPSAPSSTPTRGDLKVNDVISKDGQRNLNSDNASAFKAIKDIAQLSSSFFKPECRPFEGRPHDRFKFMIDNDRASCQEFVSFFKKLSGPWARSVDAPVSVSRCDDKTAFVNSQAVSYRNKDFHISTLTESKMPLGDQGSWGSASRLHHIYLTRNDGFQVKR